MKIEMTDTLEGRQITASFSIADMEMATQDELKKWEQMKPTDILFYTYILSLKIEKKKGQAFIQKVIR